MENKTKQETCNICKSKARIERPVKDMMFYGEKYCTNPECRAYKENGK